MILGLDISTSITGYSVVDFDGKVITIGELVKEVKEGMVVYFDKVAGSDIRIKGEKYKAIRERDVVVMLDDANTPI